MLQPIPLILGIREQTRLYSLTAKLIGFEIRTGRLYINSDFSPLKEIMATSNPIVLCCCIIVKEMLSSAL